MCSSTLNVDNLMPIDRNIIFYLEQNTKKNIPNEVTNDVLGQIAGLISYIYFIYFCPFDVRDIISIRTEKKK